MQRTYQLRSARVSDSTALGHIHVQIWREAYAGLLPQDFLDGLDPRDSAARWRERVEGSVAGVTRLLATSGTDIVGFVVAGPPRDELPRATLELAAINVVAAHRGTGVADQLLTAAIGDSPAYLWVLEGNDRARAFYRRHGFALDGGEKPHPPTGATEQRMTRRFE